MPDADCALRACLLAEAAMNALLLAFGLRLSVPQRKHAHGANLFALAAGNAVRGDRNVVPAFRLRQIHGVLRQHAGDKAHCLSLVPLVWTPLVTTAHEDIRPRAVIALCRKLPDHADAAF